MNDDPAICPDCNGSGEGMHDGTRCSSCKGRGVEIEAEEDDSADCFFEQARERRLFGE